MATITLSLPKNLKERMDKTNIKWSQVLREMIITKIEKFKKFEKIIQ